MKELSETIEEYFKNEREEFIKPAVAGWLIPDNLTRSEKIEWEIDHRFSGGEAQLDLTLKQLIDLSEKFNRASPLNINKKETKVHPNNNQEPMR